MPRRLNTNGRDIPLFLVPHVIIWGIRMHSDKLHQVFGRMTRRNFSNVSIRTRSIKRELKGMQTPDGSAVPVRSAQEGERV